MDLIEKYGNIDKQRIYIHSSKLENQNIDLKEFRKLKGRFIKKFNHWVFPLTDKENLLQNKIEKIEKIDEIEESEKEEEIEESEKEEEIEESEKEEEVNEIEEIEDSEKEEEIEEEEEIKEVNEIEIDEKKNIEDLCVDKSETESENESENKSFLYVDKNLKFEYIIKPPQELYEAIDDYLKIIK